MTDLRDLSESDLRRTVRYLLWKCNRFHSAARWLLLICCVEAVLIVWLVA